MRYVGYTKQTMMERWSNHVCDALRHGHMNAFAVAIREHGPKAFDHDVICDDVADVAQAKVLERHYVEMLNTWGGLYGYNQTRGGNGSGPRSEATRVLIKRRTREGMAKIDPEVRRAQKERQHKGMMGHKVSDEVKLDAKVRGKERAARGQLRAFFSAGGKSRKGSHHREESKQLMRQNANPRRGDNHPMKRPQMRRRASAWLTRRPVSVETRQKIGKANSLPDMQKLRVIELLHEGLHETDVAKIAGVARTTVRRIKGKLKWLK